MVTQIDTASPQPAFLATNDYSLILQTALAIGRPMPSPNLPKISKNEGIQATVNHIKTPLRHPSLVGTYHFHTHIQVITPSGEIVGLVNCRRNGRYRVTISTPLSPGTYYFRIRAYDDAGNLSNPSKLFAIKVVPRRHDGTKT
jgi:Bacterial Ig-like domain